MPRSSRRWFQQFQSRLHQLSRLHLWRRYPVLWLLCLSCIGAALGITASTVHAQGTVQQQEEQLIREFVLPNAPAKQPVFRPRPAAAPQRTTRQPANRSQPERVQERPAAPARGAASGRPRRNQPAAAQQPSSSPASAAPVGTGEYILTFNRSPVVGNRFRLQGVFSEARLGFTRPRDWDIKGAKVILRYQHSPALLASRSNLTVRVNGTSVGSVPLNRRQSEIGQAVFNVPASVIQDFNEVTMVAQQNNSATCTDPADPTLWTEILPDSSLVFNFSPKAIALDFARYPYPFLDTLGLNPDRIAYLRPREISEAWMTAAARLQTSLGNLAEFRPLETRVVNSLGEVRPNERLIIIGTPAEQPILSRLQLPYPVQGNQVLDGSKSVLPGDVGLLMMGTANNGDIPVLVATGNDPIGVGKAVQALVQPDDRKVLTGAAMVVSSVNAVPTPDARDWKGFLPLDNNFKLSDLMRADGKPYEDITVNGSYPPPISIDFKALPDDRFVRGNTMTLDFSYGPQINTRTSAVEIRLDDVAIGGKPFNSVDGGRDRLTVNLPENLVTPTSKLSIHFVMPPRDPQSCGKLSDEQIWGTVHASTSFNLKRENAVTLPSLELLQTGFPLTAPQDLSSTAIVMSDAPTSSDVVTMLEVSERLGRISQPNSVKLDVYRVGNLPVEVRNQKHLVGIGARDRFPLPEVFQSGFSLGEFFSRRDGQTQVQALPDSEGVLKSVISPWNGERILLALTGQSEQGLTEVRDLFGQDPLFFQIKGDTVLISSNGENPSPYDSNAYNLDFLEESKSKQIDRSGPLGMATNFLKNNWFLLPTGIVMASLLLYGATQFFLNRAGKGGAK